MKLNEAITYVDELKPNAYGPEVKTKWLSDLDRDIFETVIKTKADYVSPTMEIEKTDDITGEKSKEIIELPGFTEYEYGKDGNKELIISPQFTDAYFYYMSAKIDFLNKETESYANNMIMYNEMYNAFCAYYTRNHLPKQPNSIGV